MDSKNISQWVTRSINENVRSAQQMAGFDNLNKAKIQAISLMYLKAGMDPASLIYMHKVRYGYDLEAEESADVHCAYPVTFDLPHDDVVSVSQTDFAEVAWEAVVKDAFERKAEDIGTISVLIKEDDDQFSNQVVALRPTYDLACINDPFYDATIEESVAEGLCFGKESPLCNVMIRPATYVANKIINSRTLQGTEHFCQQISDVFDVHPEREYNMLEEFAQDVDNPASDEHRVAVIQEKKLGLRLVPRGGAIKTRDAATVIFLDSRMYQRRFQLHELFSDLNQFHVSGIGSRIYFSNDLRLIRYMIYRGYSCLTTNLNLLVNFENTILITSHCLFSSVPKKANLNFLCYKVPDIKALLSVGFITAFRSRCSFVIQSSPLTLQQLCLLRFPNLYKAVKKRFDIF